MNKKKEIFNAAVQMIVYLAVLIVSLIFMSYFKDEDDILFFFVKVCFLFIDAYAVVLLVKRIKRIIMLSK